jgi:hypothetical protein
VTSTTTSEGGLRRSLIDEDGVPEVELRNYAAGWLKGMLVHMLRVRASTGTC